MKASFISSILSLFFVVYAQAAINYVDATLVSTTIHGGTIISAATPSFNVDDDDFAPALVSSSDWMQRDDYADGFNAVETKNRQRFLYDRCLDGANTTSHSFTMPVTMGGAKETFFLVKEE